MRNKNKNKTKTKQKTKQNKKQTNKQSKTNPYARFTTVGYLFHGWISFQGHHAL